MDNRYDCQTVDHANADFSQLTIFKAVIQQIQGVAAKNPTGMGVDQVSCNALTFGHFWRLRTSRPLFMVQCQYCQIQDARPSRKLGCTLLASIKLKPCFAMFCRSLSSSHSKSIVNHLSQRNTFCNTKSSSLMSYIRAFPR